MIAKYTFLFIPQHPERFSTHTATRSADHASGSRVTSGHTTAHWKTLSSFRGTAAAAAAATAAAAAAAAAADDDDNDDNDDNDDEK